MDAGTEQRCGMAFLSWLAVGVIVGLLTHWLVSDSLAGGFRGTVAGGMGGGLLGGATFTHLARDYGGCCDFDLASLPFAVLGAVALMAALWKLDLPDPGAD
jgi:uncharacterized membrane protein YeaQ/YmgE (transglycosylase-associated protein family)